jgi:hypothetical protein
MNQRIPAIKSQALIGASLLLAGLWLANRLGGEIVSGDLQSVALAGAAFVGGAGLLIILKNWRTGFYVFFVWLMFEDLVRKYMGNGLAFFFGKDILLACVYLAFYISVRQGREKTFRPPFLLFFSLFFWLAVLQLFNPYSPNILYGLLGLKVYFYYMPLLFVGYAMINSDEDLRKFLVVNAGLAGIISALGIIQAILGNSFLNPKTLAPELQELGDLTKVSPLTNQSFSLPPSVFVSSGRFASYLIVSFIIVLGAAAYLLLYTRRSRRLIYLILGLISVAVLLSGSRGALLYVIASAIVISGALLWGRPATKRESRRVSKTIRRSVVFAGVSLAVLLLLFPKEAGSRIAFYSETLFPSSSAYQLSNRSWDYPIQNLMSSFQQGSWVVGHGLGTASLGRQYVAKLLGKPALKIGAEEGYGVMILEMGVLAPILWILWTAALLYYAWKTVRQLRGTRFFPLAFAFLWYAFMLLYPSTYASLNDYQNYISNAYLWLLAGILFRLPDILATSELPAVVGLPDQESTAV